MARAGNEPLREPPTCLTSRLSALAAKGDHFGAIKAAGLDLDAAVRQVMMAEEAEKNTEESKKQLDLDERIALAQAKLAAAQDALHRADGNRLESRP